MKRKEGICVETAFDGVCPVLLGDGYDLFCASVQCNRRFGVAPVALTRRAYPVFSRLFRFSYHKLASTEDAFLCDLLSSFVHSEDEAAGDSLVWCLVPCDDGFRNFVNANRARLETAFVCLDSVNDTLPFAAERSTNG